MNNDEMYEQHLEHTIVGHNIFYVGLEKANANKYGFTDELKLGHGKGSANTEEETWHAYIFRVADVKSLIDEFLARVKKMGTCSYVQRVPKVVASTIATAFFVPIERQDAYMYCSTYGCDVVKPDKVAKWPYARLSHAGYRYIRSLMEG